MPREFARPSLMQRALGIFVLLAFALGMFLWLGKTYVHRRIESVHLDTQRLAALRTFERAIVPLKTVPNYTQPSADLIREQFRFCADPLKETHREFISARERRTNACANVHAPEEFACYLRAINAKLFEMGGNGRVDRERMLGQTYVVSVERWIGAIRIAQQQQSPGSPLQGRAEDRRESVSCGDELAAARQLAANDGRLLGQLAWRDLTSAKSVDSGFAQDQVVKVTARMLEQRNPWGGIPGCIYYGRAGGELMFVSDRRKSNRPSCLAMRPPDVGEKNLIGAVHRDAEMALDAADPAWTEPETLDAILADLDNIRFPWKELYRAYTESPRTPVEQLRPAGSDNILLARPHGPNELEFNNHKVDAGFNVHLTVQPEIQRIAQQVSSCYAGDANACRIIGVTEDRKFKEYTGQMYEHAAVRMAAVAVIDVASGKIEALGSAHTDCYRQEYDGPGRNAGECPDLPTTPHYEPDRLLNHALYVDALPASTIKPIMAIGYLHDRAYRKKLLTDRIAGNFTRFQDELKSSDSAAFLDRMFCKDTAWNNCQRPHLIQDAAQAIGWDPGCVEPSFRCGRLDVLFGLPSISRIRKDTGRTPLGASIIYGRLLTEPADGKSPFDFRLMHDFTFDATLAAECSRGDHYFGSGQNPAWRKCRQGHFSKLEQEGWGQGNARATVVGEAGMIARLAAAANGQDSEHLPYLVDRITDAKAQNFDLAASQFHLGDAVKIDIPREDAMLILQGMISHKSRGVPSGTRTGTANGACIRVFDTAACNKIDWIAGKTGTPPYGNDGLTLAEIKKKCGTSPDAKSAGGELQEWQAACTRERPYKWYIAAFQTGEAGHGFDKAIAVLSERNWHRSGPFAGKVQSPGDHDEMNVSAEIAFRIVDRIRARHAPATVTAAK